MTKKHKELQDKIVDYARKCSAHGIPKETVEKLLNVGIWFTPEQMDSWMVKYGYELGDLLVGSNLKALTEWKDKNWRTQRATLNRKPSKRFPVGNNRRKA